MDIKDFIGQYKNYPVLFIGSGISMRYINEAKSWDGLLEKICLDLTNNERAYLDLKNLAYDQQKRNISFEKLGSLLAKKFDDEYQNSNNQEVKKIEEIFYPLMKQNIRISPFKLYIAESLKLFTEKVNFKDELESFKKATKNVSSIITTNYDDFIEKTFKFDPLIGNEIILSNPYGSVYKIHGSVSDASKIVITSDDYEYFEKKYDLIRAQLLSLFIHNPVIFLGYSINDENIKKILKTVFSYVEPNSTMATKLKDNFLVVEYEKGSDNTKISDYGINIDENNSLININRIKTDNYLEIYEAIANLKIQASVMEMRKIQDLANILCEPSGNEKSIKVQIMNDLDEIKNLNNGSYILSLSKNDNETTKVHYTLPDLIEEYFQIIESSDREKLIPLINDITIKKSNWAPVFGFSKLCTSIKEVDKLKKIQKDLIEKLLKQLKENKYHSTPMNSVINIINYSQKSYRPYLLLFNILEGRINYEEIPDIIKSDKIKDFHTEESFQKSYYNKLICIYDYLKFK